MRKEVLALPVAVAALVGLGSGTVAHAASAATPKAVSSCSSPDAAIYAPPSAVTASPGTVLACENTPLPQLSTSTAFSSWKIQYATTTLTGAKSAASGTVIVPKAAWTGSGTRPLVSFAPGTLGSGPQCALSKQLGGKFQDEYEDGNLNALLAAGFAVAATDGQGYLNGQVHTYIVGANAGHAVLDAAKAAFTVPGAGLSPSTKVGLWGYSEGGASSLWGSQLAASYAPQLHIVGDASGGVPSNLRKVAAQLDGGAFAGFLVDAVAGLSTSYPTLPFASLLNAQGRTDVQQAESLCVVGTVAALAGQSVEKATTASLTLDQIYALRSPTGQTWGQAVDAQALGVGVGTATSGAQYKIGFPVFDYRGAADEIVETSQQDALRSSYCKAGIPTSYSMYPGDHLLADSLATSDVVSFLTARFAGTPVLFSCLL